MKSDSPIVEEVRRRRMEISARFDHDLEKYIAHLKEIERQYGDRVVNQLTVIRSPSAAQSVKPLSRIWENGTSCRVTPARPTNHHEDLLPVRHRQ